MNAESALIGKVGEVGMRLIDADAIRVEPKYMENICGIAMIRAEDLARILNEQQIIPYDMKWNPECEDCLPEGIDDCIECHKRQQT